MRLTRAARLGQSAIAEGIFREFFFQQHRKVSNVWRSRAIPFHQNPAVATTAAPSTAAALRTFLPCLDCDINAPKKARRASCAGRDNKLCQSHGFSALTGAKKLIRLPSGSRNSIERLPHG
jgi:hypothetical protein